MTAITTPRKKLPPHLHPAWDWTSNAGELDGLRDAEEPALTEYVDESVANFAAHWRDGGWGEGDVTEESLRALHDWLRLHRTGDTTP